MADVLLAAGTRKGLFFLESDDERREWRVRGPALKGWSVSDVTDDPGAESGLLAAVGHFVYGQTIQRSDDDGRTWEQVESSPAYGDGDDRELNQIWSVVPGAEPDVWYAGVDEAGLFESTDGGETWTELAGLQEHETREQWMPGFGGLCVHSILPHPTDPDQLWVGISAVGVFKTEDGGGTWELQNDGLDTIGEAPGDDAVGSCVHRLIHDPENPDHLYQQNHMGVFRSRNGGDDWEAAGDGLPSTFGFPMVMHPDDADTLYTFPLESDEYRMAPDGEPAVYRSTDAGDSWEPTTAGLPDDSWVTVLRQSMATDGLDDPGIYAGTTGGDIYYSRDAGDTWDAMDCRLPRILSLTAVVRE